MNKTVDSIFPKNAEYIFAYYKNMEIIIYALLLRLKWLAILSI